MGVLARLALLARPVLSDHGAATASRSLWVIPALHSRSRGPALFVWDTGVLVAPLTNTPPTSGPDPHGTTPRTFPAFWSQMHTFFTTGRVHGPCGARP
jgi:hypothetical protein